MKEWHIIDSKRSYTLLTEQMTLLKGNITNWTFVINDLATYFSHQSSQIKLKENQTLIPKQDHSFSLISFSEQKNSNDYEKAIDQIQLEFFGLLQLSPFYKQLVDSWEELMEEVELLSENNNFSPLPFKLQSFDKNFIKKNLFSGVEKNNQLSAFEQLLLKIRMIEYTTKSKNTIFGLVHPENQLTTSELQQLDTYLQSDANHSRYFIVSNYAFSAVLNVLYKGNIITKQNCWNKREELQKIIPIDWSEKQFSHACNWYMLLVDNSQGKTVDFALETVDNLTQFIYIYSLFLLTNTPVIVDLTDIPVYIINYFDNLIEGKV